MNTPEQQAILYRKAAETIEMCAPHNVEPIVKVRSTPYGVFKTMFDLNILDYEFPLAVISGQLVWADTVVFDRYGNGCRGTQVIGGSLGPYTLTPPKRTVMVELLVEDAAEMTKFEFSFNRVSHACRKALDNLKGDKS
jgi:hypothetical protein